METYGYRNERPASGGYTALKYIAILCFLICLALLVYTGYLFMTCEVTAESVGLTATDAASQPEMMRALRLQYPETLTGADTDYVFYTYTVRVRNDTFVPIEEIQGSVKLVPGDICQVPDHGEWTVGARQTGDLAITILTRTNTTPVRDATVSWYLWGRPSFAELIVR